MRVVGAMMTSMSGGVGSLPDSMLRKCLAHSEANPANRTRNDAPKRINQGHAGGWRA